MKDLNNCIDRSIMMQRESLNTDLREVRIFTPHAWGNIHASLNMVRCDQAASCIPCGSTSSDDRTEPLTKPCNPMVTGYYDNILNTMPYGIFPYSNKWRSGQAKKEL